MKKINNTLYFLPRISKISGGSILDFTVDTVLVTADTTEYTADMTKMILEGGFVIKMTNEMTKEEEFPEFVWSWEDDFVKVVFDKEFEGNFSVTAYNDELILYKGRFANLKKGTVIEDNKMYL